jgi:uncharacterized protein (TIGR03435 family)
MPRGAVMMMMSPQGMTAQASASPITTLIGLLQQFVGRPVFDKTDVKGLFDFKLTFSPEGIQMPGAPPGAPTPFGPIGPGPGGAAPAAAAEPLPSIFTAVQELGLRLESTKGPVEVLVVDGAQKPTEN